MLEIELTQALVNSSVFDSVRAAFFIIVPTGIYTCHVLMKSCREFRPQVCVFNCGRTY